MSDFMREIHSGFLVLVVMNDLVQHVKECKYTNSDLTGKISTLSLLQGMVTVRKYGLDGAKWYFAEAKQNRLLSLHNSFFFFFFSFYYFKKRKSHRYL